MSYNAEILRLWRAKPGKAGIILTRLCGSRKAALAFLQRHLAIKVGTARGIMRKDSFSSRLAKYILLRADEAKEGIEKDYEERLAVLEARREILLDNWALARQHLEAVLRGEQPKAEPIPPIRARDDLDGRKPLAPVEFENFIKVEESNLFDEFEEPEPDADADTESEAELAELEENLKQL